MRKLFILIFTLFIGFPAVTQAAELVLSLPKNTTVSMGSQFEITATVNTGSDTLNAFSGSISFPNKSVALQTIRDGSSVVNFWVEQPHEIPLSTEVHSVNFSGTIPGGFKGSGVLFSLVFQAIAENVDAKLVASDLISLKHDGLGTSVATTSKPLSVRLAKAANGEQPANSVSNIVDTSRPKPFEVFTVQNPDVYENKWTVVFTTNDPESGIDHYEVQESDSRDPRESGWTLVTSPHPLVDQELKSWVHVKAVNRAGLVTIETIQPANPARIPKTITAGVVAKALVILAVIILLPRLAKRALARNKNVKQNPLKNENINQ